MITPQTPAPWKVDHSGGMTYIESAVNGQRVCRVVGAVIKDAELIAAAPDLLASLEEALPLLKGHQETVLKKNRYEQALAAINKAKGINHG